MTTVAALMPTIKSHARFRPTAERCFANQVYPSDWRVHLIIDEHETDSLGKKLNKLCAACVDNCLDYAVLWDDDDWYRKDRIYRQVNPLIATPADLPNLSPFQVSGTSQVFYQDGKEAWLYSGDPAVWMYGLAFPIAVWQKHPFEDISKGVDTAWLKKHIPAAARFDCNDSAMSLATIHSSNTCPKHTVGPRWSRVSYYQLMKEIMKEQQ